MTGKLVTSRLSKNKKSSHEARRQKLWEKLTSDPDVAATCQMLDGNSKEVKLHSI